ncbi:hypothetical protein AX14_008245 [Amanita brunnescens Koide BX004]|nr:hypothetical protein AX14_008245 [Amanita brunnescens Koide BX004]
MEYLGLFFWLPRLEQTLYTIIECYLTREQQALFGTISSDSLSENVYTPPSSRSPHVIQHIRDYSLFAVYAAKPLRAVKCAINRRDGPLFLTAMARVNAILHALKHPRLPQTCLRQSPVMHSNKRRNYQRVVGPNVVSLKQIVHITGLREESLFLDLGSGLGNVVVQASLQTGCRSYGIQPMSAPARIARDMAEQTRIRCRGHTRMMLGEAFIVLLRLPTISMTLQELAQNHY